MRKTLVIVLLFVGTLLSVAETFVSATDSRITYVGRTLQENGRVSYDWTGTYFRIAFTGTRLRMACVDSGCDWFNVWIDSDMSSQPDRVIRICGDTVITLYANDNNSRTHRVTVQKRTEGEQGKLTIRCFITDGQIVKATPLKSRQIEFVGDSYTCGYGVENSVMTDRFSPETENSNKSFASIIARYFDADYVLIAHSGMGVSRNYNSKLKGWYMPKRYLQTLDMDSSYINVWQASQHEFKPAVTVVFLGGNDFSKHQQPTYEVFASQYFRLLMEIKANYGADHPVLCCTKRKFWNLFEYVRRMALECDLDNVHYLTCFDPLYHDDNRNLGASFHPNYEAHRKMAYMLIPYISTLTEWELDPNKIK